MFKKFYFKKKLHSILIGKYIRKHINGVSEQRKTKEFLN